jgi:hypothetical protein
MIRPAVPYVFCVPYVLAAASQRGSPTASSLDCGGRDTAFSAAKAGGRPHHHHGPFSPGPYEFQGSALPDAPRLRAML